MKPRGSRPRLASIKRRDILRGSGIGFLLSQVGAQSSLGWNERLRAQGLESRGVMLLWNVALEEGRSQRELAEALGLPGSRIVGLVDALEAKGLIERRLNAHDRRTRALHLTRAGRALFRKIISIAMEFERQQSKGLTPAERQTLAALLAKVAAKQGLTAHVHPGF
jgi:DNA-binding MarR family transcriptional regulator